MSNLKNLFKFSILLFCFKNTFVKDINLSPCYPAIQGYLCKTNNSLNFYDGLCKTKDHGDDRISYCEAHPHLWYRSSVVRY